MPECVLRGQIRFLLAISRYLILQWCEHATGSTCESLQGQIWPYLTHQMPARLVIQA